jgi:hypothetical protein
MATKEEKVRTAAAALQIAIADAAEDGFVVEWPRRFEDLAFIAISESGKGKASVILTAPAGSDAEALAKAGAAAQKAADKVLEPK